MQDVPYLRENAGIALAGGGVDRTTAKEINASKPTKKKESHLLFMTGPQ